MPNLWIVHRNPQSRMALARIAGRAASETLSGGPSESEFVDCPSPAAIVLGLEGDFEVELEFVHRMRTRIGSAKWILLASPEDSAEAARLFDAITPDIIESLPTARLLRSKIAEGFARRRVESLAERRSRARIADRFSAWLGGIEIPGLLRALDPSLGHLPLLVRGVPGSGRALLARYVELFRAGGGPLHTSQRDLSNALRIHARDVTDVGDLARRIASGSPQRTAGAWTIWIDEVDALSIAVQNALAQWVVHEAPPGATPGERLHWLATAGPSAWQDPLEPALEHAFAPLVIEVPALSDEPDALPTFAREIARDWSRTVGGPLRTLGTSALADLAAHPWQGDRSEVEAVLRATFAATNHDPVEVDDLRYGSDRIDSIDAHAAVETRPGQQADEEPIVEVIALEEDGVDALDAPDALFSNLEDRHEASDLEPATWFEQGDPDLAALDEIRPGVAPGSDESAPKDTSTSTPEAAAASVDESVLLSEASFEVAASDEPLEPAAQADANAVPPVPPVPDQTWRRLARSLSHEIRNPLVSIRTFAELLPEHYEDETFRARFADLVGRDVAHIDEVVTRMQSVSEHDDAGPEAMDVSAMLEELLEERRERIAQRRLLVLRELERDAPMAWAEPHALRIALAGLLDQALDSLPERGDLFVATRRIDRGPGSGSRLRILLRHHNPEAQAGASAGLDELRPEANVLEYVLAETVARAHGGSLTIDTSDAQESLILLELRTPA